MSIQQQMNDEAHRMAVLVSLASALRSPVMTECRFALLMKECGIADRAEVEATPVHGMPMMKEAA